MGDRESTANVYDIRIMRAWVFLLRHTAYTCQPKRPDLSEADLSLQTHIHARASVYTRAYSDYSPKETYAVDTENLEFACTSECIAPWNSLPSATRSSDSFFSSASNLIETIPFCPNKRTNTHAPRINDWAAFDVPTSLRSTLSVVRIFLHSVKFIKISRILHCKSCERRKCGLIIFISLAPIFPF